MQVALKRTYPGVEIFMGGIEDYESLLVSLRASQPDILIHAAAMKHVETGETNPLETCKINICGSANIIKGALNTGVKQVIGISTDKACLPDCVYGHTKLLMEKMFLQGVSRKTKFSICRFGNVTYSHGSVLPYWFGLLNSDRPLDLTSQTMNRLMFSRKEAAHLIEYGIQKMEKSAEGFILSRKMKTINLSALAQALSSNIIEVGVRPGEKLEEDLISPHEVPFCHVEGEYIVLRPGSKASSSTPLSSLLPPNTGYSTKTAPRATPEEVKKIIQEGESLRQTPLSANIY